MGKVFLLNELMPAEEIDGVNVKKLFFDTIKSFAKGIFINYVWAFELVSLLLTVVIAGIGLLRTDKRTNKGAERNK